MPNRPKFIDGIYNYCDRWCERCAFTARCRTFAMEKQMRRELRRQGAADTPPTLPSWETYDALAEEIEPWLSAQYEQDAAKSRESQEQAWDQPLARRGEAYIKAVDKWFKRHRPDQGAAETADAVAVIRWYQHFIVIKLIRASSADDLDDGEGTHEPDDDPETREVIDQADRDDNNGSAKVALIGIDRSIAAWTVLARAGLPHTEDLTRDLDSLRRVAEQVFPNAREFIRPGLDWPE